MSKTVNISLPEELLCEIDAAAKSEYASRSDYIRETLVRRLKGQRVVSDTAGQCATCEGDVSVKSTPEQS